MFDLYMLTWPTFSAVLPTRIHTKIAAPEYGRLKNLSNGHKNTCIDVCWRHILSRLLINDIRISGMGSKQGNWRLLAKNTHVGQENL